MNQATLTTPPPAKQGAPDRGAPIATIVISTRNRKDELRRTLASCLTLDAGGGWIEVLVVDDDSTDGTRDMIAAEFPGVRVIHKPKATGYIVSRNMGAREARGPIIFSIDDDAVYSSPDIVIKTIAEFDHPRIGAVAIPHIHVPEGPREYDRSPSPSEIHVGATYVGTAHALRRDLFLALGGYQETFIHQAEESEYCLRLYENGYVVRLGNTAPIHHFPSMIRNYKRQLYLGARNSVLTSWINAPLLFLPGRLAGGIINGFRNSIRLRQPRSFLSGVFTGLFSIPKWWGIRRPMAIAPYRLTRRLVRRGPMLLSAALPSLPPPRPLEAIVPSETALRA